MHGTVTALVLRTKRLAAIVTGEADSAPGYVVKMLDWRRVRHDSFTHAWVIGNEAQDFSSCILRDNNLDMAVARPLPEFPVFASLKP